MVNKIVKPSRERRLLSGGLVALTVALALVASLRYHMNDWSYNCFAKALADAIADAATPRESSNASATAPTGETR